MSVIRFLIIVFLFFSLQGCVVMNYNTFEVNKEIKKPLVLNKPKPVCIPTEPPAVKNYTELHIKEREEILADDVESLLSDINKCNRS